MLDKDAYIKQLETHIQQLDKENKELKDKLDKIIKELENTKKQLNATLQRLRVYENPHTPPSLRQFSSKRVGERKANGGKPGRKNGHEGVTREIPEPNEWIEVTEDKCSHCGSKLGEPIGSKKKIVIEIPEPQPLRVIEFTINHYECENCKKEVVASHPDCPAEGIFGRNMLSHTVLMKYRGRLTHRKIKEFMKWIYDIDLSTATIFDFTRRVSDSLRPEYDKLMGEIRKARVLYADETGIKVNGQNYWIWLFTTKFETLVVIAKIGVKRSSRRLSGILMVS